MGAPDNPEGFIQFEADDITVYVTPQVLGRLIAGAERMLFYIDGYGGFWLTFAEPWSGMGKQDGSLPMNTLSDTQEEKS